VGPATADAGQDRDALRGVEHPGGGGHRIVGGADDRRGRQDPVRPGAAWSVFADDLARDRHDRDATAFERRAQELVAALAHDDGVDDYGGAFDDRHATAGRRTQTDSELRHLMTA
jgi:hypothetical protein